MNSYGIFTLGAFLGMCLGFLAAALLGAAHRADHPQELWQAYQDGFDAGQAKPGSTLAEDGYGCCGVKPVTAEQIDGSRS